MQENDVKYWVWLSSIPKLSPKKRGQLVEFFGSPETVWKLSKLDLKNAPFVTETISEQILCAKHRDAIEYHMENIRKNNIKVLKLCDEAYPNNLKTIHDPPLVLYVKGDIAKDEKAVAIVGSRKASPYGMDMAELLAYELSKYEITIASGMARGVDTRAHNGAIKAKGRTVAVLGCGLDIVYPAENKNLMNEIQRVGAVISEYLPGTQPAAYNFPARNRIISGLSLGVIVIEAGEKSGSLITADFALDQGREVFAVPGNINSLNSKGSNKLIREGAKIVTCVEDVLEELNVILNREDSVRMDLYKSANDAKYIGLDDDEMAIVNCLKDEPLQIDVLSSKTGYSAQAINSMLIMMELKGIIEQIPGKVYKLRG